MKETVGSLIDKLSVVNIKIFMLVDKVQKHLANIEEAEKLQELNSYRSKLINAINKHFKQRQEIKI